MKTILAFIFLYVHYNRYAIAQGVYRYYDLNATQQAMLVNEHNRLRAIEPAIDMQELVWDSNLAIMAKAWAGQCAAYHSSSSVRRDRYGYSKVGETIWWSDEKFLRDDLTSVVKSYYAEKALYTFATRGCVLGANCKHYTQVVWAQTCAVGCSAAYCANIVNGGNIREGHIVVCNYGPTGNYYGRDPYNYGKQCGACPLTCTSNGLCPSSCSGSQPQPVRAPPPLPQPLPQPVPAPPPQPQPLPQPVPQSPTAMRQQQVASSSQGKNKCIDKSENCPSWAKYSECEKNPNWMNDNCHSSCNPQECGKKGKPVS